MSTLRWCIAAADATVEWDRSDGVPTARVSLDDAASDPWPAIQPGPFDSDGGFIAHRVEASFTLAADALLRLELHFSSERGPCPDLEISVDQKYRGIFHPVVERSDRSETGQPGPIAGSGRLHVPLPSRWMNAGKHTFSITTVLDEGSALGEHSQVGHDVRYRPNEELPAARGMYGSWFGSYLRWSSVALVTSESDSPPPSAVIRPTPLFIKTEGAVSELIDIDISWSAGDAVPTDLTLHWGGEPVDVPAPPAGRDFGMFRWRHAVAEFTDAAPAQVTAGGIALGPVTMIAPCRQWDLHLIPHVHLDLGFTDTQGKVLELHCRNIDRALDLFDDDPEFKFSVDGSIIAQEYTRTRSSTQIQRLKAAIRAGRLGINGFHSNFLTGIVSLEEIYRSTEFALTLPPSAKTSMRYANLTDVPTYTSSIPAVLKKRGIGGFVGMSNHGRAATDTSDDIHLKSPVRWQAPDGSEVLAHFADHYSQLRFIAGDPQSVSAGTDGLSRLLSRYDRADYLPNDLAVIGTHADNEDIGDGDTSFVRRWNAVFAHPRLRISTFDEYLTAVAPLADRLPVWRGESGAFWEDGVGAAAAAFGTYRRTQSLLPVTETLGAGVCARQAGYRTNRTELDRAWAALAIAAEHTLTWARATSHPHSSSVDDQFAWKNRSIQDAARVALDEGRRHAAQLAEIIGATGPGYLAYNPHAWAGDLEGEFDLMEGTDLTDGTKVLEVETLRSCNGMRRCRIALREVPAHSYRFFPLTAMLDTVPGGQTGTNNAPLVAVEQSEYRQSGQGDRIKTKAWTIDLNSETRLPQSMRHRHSGREMLDQTTRLGLGQIVRTAKYRLRPADTQSMTNFEANHHHHRTRIEHIENFRPTSGIPITLIEESPDLTFVGIKETFDGVRLRWIGGGVGVNAVNLELLLRDDSSVCDLNVSFLKQPVLDMEAIYIAFPFAGMSPVIRYDRQLGWVDPARDHAAGSSNEWGAITNTIAVDTTEGGFVWTSLDAPLFTAGDMIRGRWPTDFVPSTAHLFSYVMNNFWPCNTPPAQGGEAHFSYRFELTSAFDAPAAARFGRMARVGLQLNEITALDRYEPDTAPTYLEGQLLNFDADSNTDVQLRQGDDEAVMHLQVTNLIDQDRIVRLQIPSGLRAQAPQLAETPPHPITEHIQVRLPKFGFVHVPLERGTT